MKALEELAESRGIAARTVNFAEPWQARAFALALALADRGAFAWNDFRDRLIAEIAAAEKAEEAGAGYYECWLRALEAVLGAKRIAAAGEIDRAAGVIAANPPAATRALTAGPIVIA
jgi:nitrile hydratase accessory protein